MFGGASLTPLQSSVGHDAALFGVVPCKFALRARSRATTRATDKRTSLSIRLLGPDGHWFWRNPREKDGHFCRLNSDNWRITLIDLSE